MMLRADFWLCTKELFLVVFRELYRMSGINPRLVIVLLSHQYIELVSCMH